MASRGEVTPRTAQAQEDVEDAQRRIDAAQQRLATPGKESAAPSCNLEKCLMVLGIANMLTPLDTQAPTPLLPLLITEELALPVAIVGRVFSSMTLAAMVSFIMIMPLSKCVSPRTLLLGDFTIRLISGLFYTAALWGDAPRGSTLPLLYVSRVLYGVTLNSFALPSIWIACRMPADERPARITAMQAALTMGIILGPTWGSTMASFMPTDWKGYATAGWFTIINCSVLLGIVYKFFDDDVLLPQAPPPAVATEADREKEANAKKIIMVTCWQAFCSTMGLMAGFETLMGIGLKSSYGWSAKQAISAWGPFAISSFLGFATAPKLVDQFNWAKLVLVLTPTCLLWWALFSVHFADLRTAVPVWSLYTGMLSTIPNTAISILIYSIIAVRVPPHAQVGANALIQLVGQVGRGIGPIVATTWYAHFIDWYGSKSGYNAAVLFNLAFILLSLIPLPCIFTVAYGKLDDPSPAEVRAAKSMM